MGKWRRRRLMDSVNSESTGRWVQDVDSFSVSPTTGGTRWVTGFSLVGCCRGNTKRGQLKSLTGCVSGLFDAVGELCHLVEEVAVNAHLLVDLAYRVQHCRVVTSAELGADFWK